MGIWACGALLYTLLLKFAVPIYTGKLRFETKERRGYSPAVPRAPHAGSQAH
jgi:hypothetical protein